MSRRRAGPWTRRTGLVVLLTAVLFLVEGLARLAEPALPTWQFATTESGGSIMTGHPTRLWANGPGVRENGGTTATINQDGLRGPLPGPRPTERHRVLLLGDSTAFGHGVADGESFIDGTGELLQEEGLDVDVVNGAVAGYSIAQSRLLMEEQGWGYDPTLLVISTLWSDNTWDSFRDEDLLASRALAQKNPLAHSAAVRLLATALGRLMPPKTGQIVTVSRLGEWPEGRVRRVPLQRYHELLDELVRDAADRGVGVLLLRLGNTQQLERSDEYMSWDPYFEAMGALAEHHQLPLVDVGPLFLASGLQEQELYLDVMHPTTRGHKLIAKALRDTLLAANWPTEPLLGRAEPLKAELQDMRPPLGFTELGEGSPQRLLFPEQESR